MTSLPGRAVRDLKALVASPVALVAALILVAGSVWGLVAYPREASLAAEGDAPAPNADAQRAEFERWYTAQPRFEVPAGSLTGGNVPASTPTGGNTPADKEGAPVVIVKFNDYQCPACGQTYAEYKPLEDKFAQSHPGQVQWVTRDFPLEQECNSAVTTEFHASACEAAAAVRLAREHGTAEVLEKWIYDNQPALTPQLVRQAARDVGKVTDFDARYAATLELVKADVSLARQFGVQSTPTFLINGVKIEGGLPIQYFEQAIAFELQRAAP
jgi:protein-disulfide isomerase